MVSDINKEKKVTWYLERVAEAIMEMSGQMNVLFNSSHTERQCTRREANHLIHTLLRPKHPPSISPWIFTYLLHG